MNRSVSRRPDECEPTSPYQRQLIDKVEGECVVEASNAQMYTLCEMASNICPEQVDKVHAPYQWTIRQVLEHCANAERVFGYRMMRIAAGDSTELVGWDENAYANSRFGLGSFGLLISEIGSLRQANLLLLRRITPKAWDRMGTADGQQVSVRTVAWIAAGHLQHHMEIIAKRCDITLPPTPNAPTPNA
ncbi:DinB superfamily protein [Planctomycetes bacterium CA13]|uniref:DinB superfamily protein n=1 Tax=Novipirellula herctigrandis TaxID=2527986 RepID=A0A5C5Z3F6_9BACT|nr:DinB superfamily protein [Planctomycetes bacterium CA13]